ncbi:similar to Saccharomyces cerevisiae YJR092W BUD4 Involved in bud-site selection and required for the axial budding pattern [Maudiozyma saulgeensis]|uniref:Similar to Saccharomyces cerevisiae YJR092W BUD4 Involved in bud-site selection and required for the axial budding pattern n=1 Tax=Maudiozyma saulgeensis TaxID=1789683 RepID=A0A1X7R5J9_9SACH|nr:similar to Saccharomyces cerevisiae YJR092W BUD4 Involved in bud-site selection and required for the axial budding pattern [Kazachstania saulgeensis]
MADVTVDEVVDSLVKEIENEMENTISSTDHVPLLPGIKPTYQIPLKDIGNDTMEMIVNYNTDTNGITSSTIESEDREAQEETMNRTSSLDLYHESNYIDGEQEEEVIKSVREYTLADYDLSIGSIGTLSTGHHDTAKEVENNEEEKLISNDNDDGEDSMLETKEIFLNNNGNDHNTVSRSRDTFNENTDLRDDDKLLEERALENSVPRMQQENDNHDEESLDTTPSLNDKDIYNEIETTTCSENHEPDTFSEHSLIVDHEDVGDVHFKPLSTIGGLGSTKSDMILTLPSNESRLNNNDYIDFNGSFDLPGIVDQDPIVMTTIFEDGASTMTENIPTMSKTGQLPNDYLSIWHFQNGGNNTAKTHTGKANSPALSSASRFSDGTVTTLVNSLQGQQQTDGTPSNSNFSFKPRLVSRSKVHYPNSKESSRVNSSEVNAVVISEGHRPYSRVSSLGTSNIYSNGEYAFMGDVIDNSIDFSKENPLEFTFNDNGDFSKLNSFSFLPETSLVKKLADVSHGDSSETSFQNLEQSLSTIIDFDKPNVLSNYLENELGTGFGDFLNLIDEKNSDNLQTNNSEIIDSDSINQPKDQNNNIQSESSSINNDTILFEHFESRTPVKSIEPRQLVSKSHTESPIKVIGRINHTLPTKLTTYDSNKISKPEFVEPFSEDSVIENSASLEQSSVVTKESSLLDEAVIPNVEVITRTLTDPLPDAGKLYISFETLSFFDLEGVESHKSKFSVQCKLGDIQLNTPYMALTNSQLDIKKDLVITLKDEFFEQQNNTLEILIKCTYEKVKTDLVPVKEKVQVGKRHLFRKTKFIYKTRYVQRALDTDRWDHIFGPNGEYCKGSYTFSKDELEEVKFQKKNISISLKNKWAKGLNPYEVTSLRTKISCISRTSKDEIMPNDIKVANRILDKYRRQQSICKSGYMIQDGGDLSGRIQRRYFELDGNVLTACHETSHKPLLLINLLNVKNVSGYETYDEKDKRKFTNLTDLILLNECIQLVFENGEVISFNIEGGEEDKSDWFMKLNEVVQLNISHQPWVKNLLREEKFKDGSVDNLK